MSLISALVSLSSAAGLLLDSGHSVFGELSGVTDPTRLFSLSFLFLSQPLPPVQAELPLLPLTLSLSLCCLAGRDASLHFARDQ